MQYAAVYIKIHEITNIWCPGTLRSHCEWVCSLDTHVHSDTLPHSAHKSSLSLCFETNVRILYYIAGYESGMPCYSAYHGLLQSLHLDEHHHSNPLVYSKQFKPMQSPNMPIHLSKFSELLPCSMYVQIWVSQTCDQHCRPVGWLW